VPRLPEFLTASAGTPMANAAAPAKIALFMNFTIVFHFHARKPMHIIKQHSCQIEKSRRFE
jgi:hypothetical protein